MVGKFYVRHYPTRKQFKTVFRFGIDIINMPVKFSGGMGQYVRCQIFPIPAQIFHFRGIRRTGVRREPTCSSARVRSLSHARRISWTNTSCFIRIEYSPKESRGAHPALAGHGAYPSRRKRNLVPHLCKQKTAEKPSERIRR